MKEHTLTLDIPAEIAAELPKGRQRVSFEGHPTLYTLTGRSRLKSGDTRLRLVPIEQPAALPEFIAPAVWTCTAVASVPEYTLVIHED